MLYYYTRKASPYEKQISFDDFLASEDIEPIQYTNKYSTKTVTTDDINKMIFHLDYENVKAIIRWLKEFNNSTDYLRAVERKTLYKEFRIPKSSGGFRKIDAPEEELSLYLKKLAWFLDAANTKSRRNVGNGFYGNGYLYHTNAFAYMKGRGAISAVKKHQKNNSRWFLHLDIHDFFGSITLDWAMDMLSRIYPFCCVCTLEEGKSELRKALELGFLDGGLPQGTPLSPVLTNILMIPIDYTISKSMKQYGSFAITRYADDFHISNRYSFRYKDVEKLVNMTFEYFNAPFSINEKKTHYGSNAGKNWILGMMLNKDGDITIGAKKKRKFKAALTSYALDTKNGNLWELDSIQVLDGYINYYRQIEGETIDAIIDKLSTKFDFDIKKSIRNRLTGR